MTALWIICGVLLFFAFILFVPIGIELCYDGEIAVSVRVLFFRYRLIPKKQKKINLRKFTKKRFERMLAKEKKKAAKKAAKKQKKDAGEDKDTEEKADATEKKRKSPKIVSDLWQMRSLLFGTLRRFVGRVRTERVRVRVIIGSDNAAESALIYGAASNVAVDIQEILRAKTNMRRECEIALGVDFTSETTVADVYMRFAITIASVIATAAGFAVGYVKYKTRGSKTKKA